MAIFGNNNPRLFEKVLKPHLGQLYRTAYRLTNSRADAEDLVQDLVVKLYPRQKELQNLDKPEIWLNKVLYRMFVDNKRKYARSPIRLVGDFSEDESDQELLDVIERESSERNDSPEHLAFVQQLLSAVKWLSDEHRIPLMLYEVEGYSLQELEQILDLPIGTIKSRLHRARARLKFLLEQETVLEQQTCNTVRR